MKIVHVITSLWRGGASLMLFKLLEKLKENSDDDHYVIVLRENNRLKKEFDGINVPVHVLGINKNIFAPLKLKGLRNILKNIDPDIIQSWMYHSNIAVSLVAPKDIYKIWSIHHSLDDLENEKSLTRYLIKLGPYFSKNISSNIYCSQVSKKQHEELGYPEKKSVVVPNGFDLNEFYPSSEKGEKFKENFNLPKNKVLFGQAARYHPLKNQEGLIRSFAKACVKYSDIHLVMAGNKIDEDNSELMNTIRQNNIKKNVTLIGECKNMPGFLNALDFYCSTSLSEAFPMVIGEAMACGTPCITTDVGDSSFIVGDYGVVVDTDSEEEFANGICEMVELDCENYKDMSNAVKNRIESKFSLMVIANRYNDLYKSFN